MPDQSEEFRVSLAERWQEIDFSFTRIDSLHIRILDKLMQDCRKKNVEIAKELGISEVTVRKRIKQMEDMGLIEGYSAKVNYGAVEKSVKVYVTMRVDADQRDKIAKRMCHHPRSVSVYEVAGDNDLLSVMLFTSADEFRDFAHRHEEMEGVRRVSMQVVLAAHKGKVWSGA